ncbi:NGFI-A-binding protein homolog [Clonorchis sinensis]|uniref:NGFI-A-binding protein homolog n=1 Tax=Clonorchis sinensis TaxID=79923 RepID=G7YAQ6_CLOSI|nr:NGFI-A-binding protein homolog [Clonorchis sinensis]
MTSSTLFMDPCGKSLGSMEPSGEQPTLTAGEFEVLCLLQRANLSQYFKAFIEHGMFAKPLTILWNFTGGDDLRQLVDSMRDPEEFAELVKIVGMDKKPLHVRRLKKALEEVSALLGLKSISWSGTSVDCPTAVQQLLLKSSAHYGCSLSQQESVLLGSCYKPTPDQLISVCVAPTSSRTNGSVISPTTQQMKPLSLLQLPNPSNSPSASLKDNSSDIGHDLQSNKGNEVSERQVRASSVGSEFSASSTTPVKISPISLTDGLGRQDSKKPAYAHHDELLRESGPPCHVHTGVKGVNVEEVAGATFSHVETDQPSSVRSPDIRMGQITYALHDPVEKLPHIRPSASLMKTDLMKLDGAFRAMIPHLPKFSMRALNTKNACDKELKELLQLPVTDPKRVDGLRRHSAIFGRFDSPKRLNRPLRHFEICINELTNRLVQIIPELVTQREHLFHTARQMVNITNYGMAITETGQSESNVNLNRPSEEEIKYEISILKREKALRPDDLYPALFKESEEFLVTYLTRLIGTIVWRMLDAALLYSPNGKNTLSGRKSVEKDLPASDHTEPAETPMSCIQKLDELKKEMQELVAEEDTLRNQLRSYNKDTAELSQSQLKRQLEKIVNELHDRLSQTAKYTVIHKRSQTMPQIILWASRSNQANEIFQSIQMLILVVSKEEIYSSSRQSTVEGCR